MPNGINDISPNLRDWLLNKNLILSDSITNSGLASLAVGLGQQAQIETLPVAVQASQNIVTNGQFYRDLNLLSNPYKSMDGNEVIDINTNTIINIGNLPIGTQPLSYQQNIGSENPTSPFNVDSDEARKQMLKNKYFDADLLYKVNLNTVLVSTTAGGAYNFKESLAQRTLDTVLNSVNLGGVSQQLGVIGTDTQLGSIGDAQLVKHFGYNAAFGLAQETLGSLNLNPLSLLQGNNIYVPNYSITVTKGQLSNVVDFGAKVLGFQAPVSLLDQSSSIFSSENPIDNISRVNSMVANTGVGQVLAMINNLNQNKYKPTIDDSRKKLSVVKADTGTNGQLYAFESAERGRILDLLNTAPPVVNSTNEPFINGIPNPAFTIDAVNAVNETQFENTYGKITSEIDGSFADDFGIGPNDNVFEYGEDGSFVNKYIWGDDNNNRPGKRIFPTDKFTEPKSLLYKTQQLFKTNKMRTLTSGRAVGGQVKSEIQNSVYFNHISKGSGVLTQTALQPNASAENLTSEDIFCRTWTTFDRYNQVLDLQKNSGLHTNAGSTIRNNTHNSVLDDNGFVRIAPIIGDGDFADDFKETKIKRFMFSIENLAWNGFQPFLPNCEKGPGDPMTGTRGRIMWFPPYGMNFTDNSSVNWDTTNFIGRGEPMYTYNNTERTGTLQWQMIIDHATYINDLRDAGASDEVFASIAAGCMDLDSIVGSKMTQVEKDVIEVSTAVKVPEVEVQPQIPPDPFKVYFPNDVTSVPINYENGDGVGVGSIMADEGYITTAINGSIHPYPDNTDFGLNSCLSGNCPQGQKIILDGQTFDGWQGNAYLPTLVEYLIKKCPACRVSLSGWASQDGQSEAADANQRLSNDRAEHVANTLRTLLTLAGDPIVDSRFEFIRGEGNTGCPAKVINPDGSVIGEVDTICKKQSRFTQVSFSYDPILDEKLAAAAPPIVQQPVADLSLDIRKRYFNECSYFQKIEQEDKFIYSSIKEKVKYFHPAFHSITPEGFNSRLNFLQQCTRQGPTIREGVPTNLAFGTPPVCILRVGDFYHSKIIIDNISFSFDPLVWDLNPEGVGVQPMICTVDMSFKFIGGSSLQGPINRLQNAVSFNFFANTEIYDERADHIKKAGPTDVDANGNPRDYVLVNGANPNNFDNPPEGFNNIYGLSSGISNLPQGEINQEVRSEIETSSVQTDEEGSNTEELTITGFKHVLTRPHANKDKQSWTVLIEAASVNFLDSDGQFIPSDDEVNAYFDAGVKISLDGITTPFHYEELVVADANLRQFSLINGGITIGQEGLINGQGVVGLTEGKYHLSIYVGGTPMCKTNIEIINTGWERWGDGVPKLNV